MTKISQGIGNLWIFKNGVKGPGFMGFQASVVDSIPGDPGYTPLWKVSIAEWKTGVTPTLLGSDDAIAAAQTKGQITVTPTNAIVGGADIFDWHTGLLELVYAELVLQRIRQSSCDPSTRILLHTCYMSVDLQFSVIDRAKLTFRESKY